MGFLDRSTPEGQRRFERFIVAGIIFLVLFVPQIFPIGLPVPVGVAAQEYFAVLDKVQPGDLVLLGFGTNPVTLAYIQPLVVASINYVYAKGANIVVVSPTVPESTAAFPILLADPLNKLVQSEYGTRWCYLGYLPGQAAAYQQIGADPAGVWGGTDEYGNDIASMPIMAGVIGNDLSVFKLAIMGTGGAGDDTAAYWSALYDLDYGYILATSPDFTAKAQIFVPEYFEAALGGFTDGAQIEQLTGVPGQASGALDINAIGHLVVIFTVVASNLKDYLFGGKKKGGKK
jgi:hypothetical protein